MKKTTYRVNTPMGLVTRTSARAYAYVVLVRGDRALGGKPNAEPVHEKSGVWSSRLDLARAEARKMSDWYTEVRIFDVATGAEVR